MFAAPRFQNALHRHAWSTSTMLDRLTDNLDFHSQALNLRAERQRLIASNIANADTPGYQARDFPFARALSEAVGGATLQGAIRSAQGATHAAHLPLATGATAEPNLLWARPSQDSVDRNTVDMDRERAAFADNSVKYEATLRFINGGVRTMLDAMKSHNQG
jgi:flagellar basal-body rod protein FlgB